MQLYYLLIYIVRGSVPLQEVVNRVASLGVEIHAVGSSPSTLVRIVALPKKGTSMSELSDQLPHGTDVHGISTCSAGRIATMSPHDRWVNHDLATLLPAAAAN